MKPSWGLIFAFAMMTASLFVFGYVGKLYVGNLIEAARPPQFTQEQIDEQLAWARKLNADSR